MAGVTLAVSRLARRSGAHGGGADFSMLTDAVPQTAPEYMRHLGYKIGGRLLRARMTSFLSSSANSPFR